MPPPNRQYFSSRPATITLFTAVFLATDYFWYRQNHWLVKSVVWSRVLGSSSGDAGTGAGAAHPLNER